MCRALVTGGTSGLGLTAVRALVKHGCKKIALFSRGVREVDPILNTLKSSGVEAVHIKGDLRNRSDVEYLVPRLVEMWDGIDIIIMSYGNPGCEPCTLIEATWDDWVDAFKLYIASTAIILSSLIRVNRVKSTVIIFSSFTVNEPHPPLILADTVRQGFRVLATLASRQYPDKVRVIILELGSFKTPGAIETVKKISKRHGLGFEEYWSRMVEDLSPLRRSGSLSELEDLLLYLYRSPEYLTGAAIRFDGASTKCI